MRKPRQLQRGIYLLPTLFTVGNLFCGYSSIVKAFQRDLGPWSPWRRFLNLRTQMRGLIMDEIAELYLGKVLEVYPAMREAQDRVSELSEELAGDEI